MKAATKEGKAPTRELPQDTGGLKCSETLLSIYAIAENINSETLNK